MADALVQGHVATTRPAEHRIRLCRQLIKCAVSAELTAGGECLTVPGMKFRVIIEPDEDGVFVAECPTLPGCVSQGQSRKEALENIKDAVAGYLASLKKHGEPVPLPMTEEVTELSV